MALTAAMAWQTTRLAGATDPALRHHLAIALRTEGNLAIVIGFLSVILGIAARLVFAPRHSLVRMQTQIAATGSAIALLPFVIWFATSPRPAIPLSLAIYCLGLFPLAFAYAIVRAQLFDIRLVLRNSVLYVTLSLGLGAVYTLVAIALRWLGTGMTMDRADLASQLLATLIVVALSVSLRDRLQALIDRRLFRAQYDAQAAIETTSQSLATLLDPEEIARRVVGTVAETMAVETASCLLERDGRYWPMASHGDATYPVIEADTVWRRSFQGAPRSSRGSTCGSSAPTGSRIVCTWSRPRWSCRSPSNTA